MTLRENVRFSQFVFGGPPTEVGTDVEKQRACIAKRGQKSL